MLTTKHDTVSIQASKTTDFESLYIAARQKENRVYTDEQVAYLPSIESTHVHFREWQVRKRSATRLFKWLQKKQKPLSILEVGCGNGWLSAKLSGIKDATITATDVNKNELSQATRVFRKKENIVFLQGDIRQMDYTQKKFDVIVFAASVQYFPSFEEAIITALAFLNKNGEVHILDSKFYRDNEIAAAKKRSLFYYQELGYEDMAGHYFHHSVSCLKKFNSRLLFNPDAIQNKLLSKKDIFPWIMITAW